MAYATVWRGWALVQQGRHQEGTAQIEQGLAVSRQAGLELLRPLHLGLLAEAYEKVDRFDEALTALGEALAASDEHESDAHEAENRRLKGELLLRHGDSNVTEAKTCFERGPSKLRAARAKSLELRATTSLARQSSNRYRRRSQHIPVNRLCPSIGCERPWNTHFYENDLQRDG